MIFLTILKNELLMINMAQKHLKCVEKEKKENPLLTHTHVLFFSLGWWQWWSFFNG
jgi:hypothetical protein